MLKKGIIWIGFLTLLAGCFQGEQSFEEIDPPQDAEAVNHSEEEGNDGDESDQVDHEEKEDEIKKSESETVATELYLVDSNDMVVSQILELPVPESKEVAIQAMEYLVKDGPVTPLLPNGFQAVLPEGTTVQSMNLKGDGTLVVDVSSEFKDYKKDDELKILQSMTYTLTQFDSVDQVELQIDGHSQDEMPVNGTPIEEGYSRVNGINIIETDTIDLLNSKAVTMYYPAEHNENRYYVPVTQHIKGNDDEIFDSIVQALLKGPGLNMNITHVFNSQTSLKNKPTLKKGTLELVFSKEILKDDDKEVISDEVVETLVRTLTEQDQVEAVDIQVEDVNQLTNENGEVYNEPVTKEKFLPLKKL